jgi:leucyl/phenylalanyl-tRNA--protein transferase
MPIYYLPKQAHIFPHPLEADTSGMLAIGGDLSPERLIVAYQHGIFPWYNEDEPIVWWFPNPRCVLFPEKVKVSKSMRPYFNNGKYDVSFDQHFVKVIENCREITRHGQDGTWLNDDMISAYTALHEMGYAHSVEVRDSQGEMIGGLYGIAIGKIFYGESMFSIKSNASKFALISLARKLQQLGFNLIDCQQDTPHMKSMGAELMSAQVFYQYCRNNLLIEHHKRNWNDL